MGRKIRLVRKKTKIAEKYIQGNIAAGVQPEKAAEQGKKWYDAMKEQYVSR